MNTTEIKKITKKGVETIKYKYYLTLSFLKPTRDFPEPKVKLSIWGENKESKENPFKPTSIKFSKSKDILEVIDNLFDLYFQLRFYYSFKNSKVMAMKLNNELKKGFLDEEMKNISNLWDKNYQSYVSGMNKLLIEGDG